MFLWAEYRLFETSDERKGTNQQEKKARPVQAIFLILPLKTCPEMLSSASDLFQIFFHEP